MTPLLADRIRKVLAYALAVVLTLLLLRVLSRAANGTEVLLDWELWVTLLLAVLAFLWVAAARRVRATRRPPGSGPPPSSAL